MEWGGEVIEFHLDARSGVAPYMQLIQQVRQAMRLGLLPEGDQLPTVKEVVAKVAINPNTVLKAYRELEYEGLVTARPGVGHVRHPHAEPTTRWPRTGRCAQDLRALAGRGPAGGPGRGEHRGAVPEHLPYICSEDRGHDQPR